jgi:DNA (cytosine-5)-methyltransferase 1
MLQRQRDGVLPGFPIWDDIKTFDGKPWNGIADIVCGGFPCQDISSANHVNNGKTRGIEGERSGLWKEMARVICEIRPRYALVENSPMLLVRGLGAVLRDLARIGYHAKWGVFSGFEVGAAHARKRIFILAHANGNGWPVVEENGVQGCSVLNPKMFGPWRDLQNELQIPMGLAYDPPMRGVLRNDDGLAEGVDRVSAVGDGQIPAVVELAWKTLSQ